MRIVEAIKSVANNKRLLAGLIFALFCAGTVVAFQSSGSQRVFDQGRDWLQTTGSRLATASHLLNSEGGPAVLFPLDDCLCGRVDWKCPCSSITRDGIEAKILQAMESISPPRPIGHTKDFGERILAATGFDRIEPRPGDVAEVQVTRRGEYNGGELRELMVAYSKPQMVVRGLALLGEGPRKGLLIHTNASWTSAETPLSIGDPAYLRKIGAHFFSQGYDILALDHGSNGHLESALNGYTLVTSGVQVFAVWARSTCDMAQALKRSGQYEKVFLYGLSRGRRTVEFVHALCDEVDVSIADDNFSPFAHSEIYWRRQDLTPMVRVGKYGAWFFHASALVGHSSLADFATSGKKELIYVLRPDTYHSRFAPILEKAFIMQRGLRDAGRVRVVFKKTDKHEPELEQLKFLLEGSYGDLNGVTLKPRSEH